MYFWQQKLGNIYKKNWETNNNLLKVNKQISWISEDNSRTARGIALGLVVKSSFI